MTPLKHTNRELGGDILTQVNLSAAEHGILITDLSKRIIYADSITKNLLGTDPVGRQCVEFLEYFACAGGSCSDPNLPCPAILKDEADKGALRTFGNYQTESRTLSFAHNQQRVLFQLLIISPNQPVTQGELTPTSYLSDLIVGEHQSIKKLRELVTIVAKTDATVHIFGENGSGNDVIANAIHNQSLRASSPFTTINCSTLPPSTVEGVLFGYVKGAVNGAHEDHPGVIETSESGTVFLDEIDELPHPVQLKLLNFLQSRTYTRVGESTSRTANIRLITASHRDLAALVRSGRIREDFYYRISVFPISVPALRNRISDLPVLINRIIRGLNAKYQKRVSGFTEEALTILSNHRWPGNVRELESVIEHSFVLIKDDLISTSHLPPYLLAPPQNEQSRFMSIIQRASKDPHEEKAEILAALEQTKGRKIEAAKLLGYSRITLWKKIAKLQLDQYKRSSNKGKFTPNSENTGL